MDAAGESSARYPVALFHPRSSPLAARHIQCLDGLPGYAAPDVKCYHFEAEIKPLLALPTEQSNTFHAVVIESMRVY